MDNGPRTAPNPQQKHDRSASTYGGDELDQRHKERDDNESDDQTEHDNHDRFKQRHETGDGDVDFFMLDNRYYRSFKDGTMLGPVQKAWLFDTLKGSTGAFKVLASPVPWTADIKPGSKDPWDGFPKEREEIFSFIDSNKVPGVFLVASVFRDDLALALTIE